MRGRLTTIRDHGREHIYEATYGRNRSYELRTRNCGRQAM